MHATHWGGPGEDYRLSKISSATIDSTDGVSAPAPDDAAPVWQPPKPAHSFPWFEVVMTTIGVLGTIGIIVFGLAPESSSVTAFVKTTLLSLVALVIVVGFLQRIDRWEPEPWTTKLAMFLWGGGVATLSAMIMNTALSEDIAATIGDFDRAEALAAAFIAPLVEETLKGIGVLIIVVVRRNSINSVLDGVVYAGFSAAGFLFFEDILYFLRTEGQGTKTLVFVFVLRALAGPFLHVMATSMTGIGLALALLKFKRGWSKTAIVIVFWFFAMLIHFVWNGSTALTGSGLAFITMYLVVGIPGFALWSTFATASSRTCAPDGSFPAKSRWRPIVVRVKPPSSGLPRVVGMRSVPCELSCPTWPPSASTSALWLATAPIPRASKTIVRCWRMPLKSAVNSCD